MAGFKENGFLKVGIIQIRTRKLDLDWNYKNCIKMIEKAVKSGARVVCTPECMLDGYSFDDQRFQREPEKYCVDPGNSEYYQGFKSLAERTRVCLLIGMSIKEESNDVAYRNAVVVFGPDGKEVGHYYKVHSTFNNLEARFYKHGEHYPVFDLHLDGFEKPVKIGVMICYDRQLPEPARILRIKGACIIFNPSATCNFNRDWNTHLIQTRAYENKCYVVSVNHAFPRMNGLSFASNPNGKVIMRCPPWNCIRIINLNLELFGNNKPALMTRRPTTYSEILGMVQ
ncbi:MAG: carbon-nitrogen hydrolase family protein [Promethearchaeota archaeon]